MPAGGGNVGAQSTAPSYQTGASGEDIKLLQNLLTLWGFNPGKIDGAFGNATATALKAFQQYIGLPITGTASGNDISYLQNKLLFDAIKVEGVLAPGMPIPPAIRNSMGPVRLDAQAVAGIQPPAPAPGTAPVATSQGGGGQGNVTIVQQGPSGPQAPALPKTDAEADTFIRQKYGSYAWMLDDPAFAEVRDVMREAARKGWDEQAFLAAAKNTTWFKTVDSKGRDWEVKKRSDPATAAATLSKNKGEVTRIAGVLGVELSPSSVDKIAEDWAKHAWQGNEMQWAVAAEAQYKPDFGGEIGAYETDIKGRARQFLMPISDEDAWRMAQKKAKGEITDEGITQHFKTQAIGLLPSLKNEIEQNIEPRTLLGGHINQIAQLLEIEPDQVDFLNDHRFQSVISHTDEKGHPRIKTIGETRQHVKGLDDYWKTTNAQNEAGQYMQVLKQTFGMS